MKEGENVTFTCAATGHPIPRILWRREDGGHLIIQAGPHEVQKGNNYILSPFNYGGTVSGAPGLGCREFIARESELELEDANV